MSNINAKNITSENITVTNLTVKYINGSPYTPNPCSNPCTKGYYVPCESCDYEGPDICDCGESCDYVPPEIDECDCFVPCNNNTSNTGPSEISYYTSPSSIGRFAFDDFMYASTIQGSNLGMRINGTFVGTGFQQIGSLSGYTGIERGGSNSGAATSVSVSTYSTTNSTTFLFNNLTINGQGLTFIFRPFALGDATSASAMIGISDTIGTSFSPTSGVYWRYTSATNVWGLFADNGAVITIVAGSQANVWCEINIIRTGANSFSSTFTIIGGASTTGTGSVASSSTNLNLGWYWGNNGTGALGAKYMDIDYISAEFNSNR